MTDSAAPPPPLPWLPHDPAGDPVDPALGGPLLVAPAARPGAHATVAVATDALLAHADRLAGLDRDLSTDALALARLPELTAGLLATAPPLAVSAARATDAAQLLIRGAARSAHDASTALRLAVQQYSDAEDAARREVLLLASVIARLLGPVLRVLVLAGLPVALGARATGQPSAGQLEEVRRWMLANPGLITSPEFVEAVRATVMSVDDATSSALGLPPEVLEKALAALGYPGVAAGAALVLAGAQPAGLFRDGPVFVDRVSTSFTTSGPQGAVERLGRVPENDQVRIERYDAPGEPARFVVYVGPTETFSPVARDEPWDLTSNVIGVAGLDSGSIRATTAAMREAGIGPGDAVQFVGFSQGGLVAARIAASGDWNASGLETYGAPSGNVHLPPGLHGLAVRNSDDFVPALAGPQLDHTLVQVERRAFEPGAVIPAELPAPAHQRSAYVATATEIDRAHSQVVRDQVTALDEFTADYTRRAGSRVTVMMYHAERGVQKVM